VETPLTGKKLPHPKVFVKYLKDEEYEFVFIKDLIYKENHKIIHDGTQCKKDG